jgi:hypothetical protein
VPQGWSASPAWAAIPCRHSRRACRHSAAARRGLRHRPVLQIPEVHHRQAWPAARSPWHSICRVRREIKPCGGEPERQVRWSPGCRWAEALGSQCGYSGPCGARLGPHRVLRTSRPVAAGPTCGRCRHTSIAYRLDRASWNEANHLRPSYARRTWPTPRPVARVSGCHPVASSLPHVRWRCGVRRRS